MKSLAKNDHQKLDKNQHWNIYFVEPFLQLKFFLSVMHERIESAIRIIRVLIFSAEKCICQTTKSRLLRFVIFLGKRWFLKIKCPKISNSSMCKKKEYECKETKIAHGSILIFINRSIGVPQSSKKTCY